MAIVELGHTGVWVRDLVAMRDFYERVLGLTVTDQDDELGIVFFSSRPEEEHHEFVIQLGRTAAPDVKLTHQISWRVDSLASLRSLHQRLLAEEAPIQQVVTHGNAYGIYFFDPEGNRNELYWHTGVEVAQPFRRSIDLTRTPEEIAAEAEQLLTDGSTAYQPVE
ncbi:VOC family protein [Kribbella solani]|uniref:Catechol-2,3-dioxygenase n=1 Tax=Kribbella solani TaxID=236067 RepID=A0A841DEK7_9ACTN|nr:VOC family protein [Kribbella solani]MBB5977524.1 catechol-2,3-dioxygenase [Kribbella solani]